MSDTNYSVDINVQSGEALSAADRLGALAGALDTAGAGAASLSQRVAAAQVALSAAAAASSAASAAVQAGADSYAANEVAADRAARAAEKLGQQVAAAAAKVASLRDAETGELGAGYLKAASSLQTLQAKHATATASASALAAALQTEGAALDALKAKASAAEQAHEQLATSTKGLEGQLEETAAATKKATDAAAGSGKVNELGEAFGRLGGPVGAAGQKLAGFVEGIQKLGGAAGTGAGAFLALTTVVVALAAAMAYAIAKTAIWAVGLADTARSASLTTQALEKTGDSMVGIGKSISSVQDATGLATDQLQGLAKQLRDAKVSAADMPAALRAVAMAESALGAGAAAELVEQLKSGKKSAGDLAKEMESKFGGIVAKKMLSLDASALKLKKNLGETFGGLNIEGLLGGLSRMVGLLDSNTASGRAVKFLFETMFQPLIDGAAAALPKVERFLLGVAIGALKIYIALKPAIAAVKEFMGAGDEGGFDWLKVGEYAAIGLAAAIGAAGVAFGLAAAPFVALARVASSVYSAIMMLPAPLRSLPALLSAIGEIDLGGLGTNIVMGLVSGLLGGLPGVVSAMLSLGDAAISALKSKLQIFSPSKVFEGFGDNTAAGFAKGVEGGTGDAQGAVEEMVTVPTGAPGGLGGRGGGATVHIEHLEINGVKDAAQVPGLLRDALIDLFSGGLTPAPAT